MSGLRGRDIFDIAAYRDNPESEAKEYLTFHGKLEFGTSPRFARLLE
jgi:hypothetical protein